LTDAAGGQHDGGREHRADAVPAARPDHVQRHAAHRAGPAVAPGGAGQHVQHQRVLDDLDARIGVHGRELGHERAGDLGPGGVAPGVRDAVGVVAALAGQAERAVGLGVEHRAAGDQLADARRSLGDQHLDGPRVAQADAGLEGVAQVRRRGVGGVERRGDAALRPDRRPGHQLPLGHQQHARHAGAQLQGRGQPGDAGPDHHRVGVRGPPRCGGGEPAREARRHSPAPASRTASFAPDPRSPRTG
jgi:hypothetical protein